METLEENEEKNFLGWASKLGITDTPLNLSHPFDQSSCLGHSLCVSHFPDAGGSYFFLDYQLYIYADEC